jgi:hypothetical protein
MGLGFWHWQNWRAWEVLRRLPGFRHAEVTECMEATEKRIERRGGTRDYYKWRHGGTEPAEELRKRWRMRPSNKNASGAPLSSQPSVGSASSEPPFIIVSVSSPPLRPILRRLHVLRNLGSDYSRIHALAIEGTDSLHDIRSTPDDQTRGYGTGCPNKKG